jgi:hypothetical protein
LAALYAWLAWAGGKCLDVKGGGSDNGTPIDLWPCNGGTNQNWAMQ